MNPFKPYLDAKHYGENAHPERPWWTENLHDDSRTTLSREGNRFAAWTIEEAEEVDRQYARPCPSPMVGQVWAEVHPAEDAGLETIYYQTIEQVKWMDGLPYRVWWINQGPNDLHVTLWSEDGNTVIEHKPADPWPPPDHVLVDGPGAPWAPPDWHADG